MKLEIIAFGIAKDILGSRILVIEHFEGITVGDLRRELCLRFPALSALASLSIAINDQYAEDGLTIGSHDEIVLIPPVSGG
jgi:molybdopterin converting factor small subunit